MQLKWRENWLRSYRITFGTREVVLDDFYYNVPVNLAARKTSETPADSVVPSESISLSNLAEDGQPVRGFYFEFESSQGFDQESSSSEDTRIRLKNLPESVLKFLNNENCLIQVDLGYEGQVELAYSGDLVSYTTTRSGADLEYILKVSAGGVSKRSSVINTSYEQGISEKVIVEDMASKFSNTVVVGIGLEDLDKRVTRTPRTFTGDLISNFENMMSKYQLNYAHQNGKIVVIPYRLNASSIQELSIKDYQIFPDNIYEISDVTDRSGEGNSSLKNKTNNVKLVTPYIPIELGQSFTIKTEDSEHLLNFAGSYLVKKRRIVASREGQFCVILEGETLDVQ